MNVIIHKKIKASFLPLHMVEIPNVGFVFLFRYFRFLTTSFKLSFVFDFNAADERLVLVTRVQHIDFSNYMIALLYLITNESMPLLVDQMSPRIFINPVVRLVCS